MVRFLLLTFAVVAAVAAIHPADSVEARLRSVTERYAAMESVLDRAGDGPSAVRAIRELDGVDAIPGLTRAYGDRVLRNASPNDRIHAEWAVAEASQRLGRRLAKWFDNGWLTGDDWRRSPFLRMVSESYCRVAESRCEAMAKEVYSMNNRGWCHWPEVEELFHEATNSDGPTRSTILRPDQFLNPWGGRISISVVVTSAGPRPVAYTNVLSESGWQRISYPSACALVE
jgi:hypothetical protein